ncbi:MAG: hypothetical protein R8K47_07780 [Mariprofundaceae bacterium]
MERDFITIKAAGEEVYVGMVCRRGGGRSGRPVEFGVVPALGLPIKRRWFPKRHEAIAGARSEAVRVFESAHLKQ